LGFEGWRRNGEKNCGLLVETLGGGGSEPALVAIPVSHQELSVPPTITFEQMKGFSLFALKAVLSGYGDELIDLAKVNLFR
jgi:hypothetical protein